MSEPALWRRLIAEGLGCVFLGAIVVGSGIAAQQLSPGATGLELLENAAATAAGLYAIILMFGGVSGAHFNPVVSFVDAFFGGLRWRDAFAYVPVQVAGCIGGAILANMMFALPAVSISTKHRSSGVFLHQLDQLRQPDHRRRTHVQQHICRHRPGVGPGLRDG
jgi:arsenate reductase